MKFDSKFSMKPNNVNPDSYPSLVDDDDDSHSESELDDNINLGVSSEQISEFCQVIFEFIINYLIPIPELEGHKTREI